MYAKIESTTWELNHPTRSTVKGCDREFYHELGCPMQGSAQDCECYVSRIRLVKTPVGDFIPTTEPDLRTDLKFWHKESEWLRHQNNRLWIALAVSSAAGLICLAGLIFELGLV